MITLFWLMAAYIIWTLPTPEIPPDAPREPVKLYGPDPYPKETYSKKELARRCKTMLR